MTPLDITGRALAMLAALALLTAAAAAVVLWRAVLPVILIAALAVTSGMVRTLALGGCAWSPTPTSPQRARRLPARGRGRCCRRTRRPNARRSLRSPTPAPSSPP
ncbi:hypothetical protein ACFQ0O_41335 [Saccharopolyspora spinosporotrichia]